MSLYHHLHYPDSGHHAISADPFKPAAAPGPHALASVAVLIPAFQPDPNLVPLVDDLLAAGFGTIVIVDDGSPPRSAPLFETLTQRPGVHLRRHAVNLGKGRALKTGLNHILTAVPACATIVMADADGQHTPADILRVALAARQSNAGFVLGVRTFSRAVPSVPLRSRFGNTLTRLLFRFLTGIKLADTQTGLRAFSRSLIPQLIQLEGERYEYEMAVLTHLCRSTALPLQVPIQTIYTDSNRHSHFDPVRDSMRICRVLIRLAMQRSFVRRRPYERNQR